MSTPTRPINNITMVNDLMDGRSASVPWDYIISGLEAGLRALDAATRQCETELSKETATACCAESVAVYGFANDAHIYVPLVFRERANEVLAALARACAAVLRCAEALGDPENRAMVERYARNLAVRYRLVEASRDRSTAELRKVMDDYAKELTLREPSAMERLRVDARRVAARAV